MQDIPFFDSFDAAQKKLTLRAADHVPEQLRAYAGEFHILDVSHGHLTELPDWLPELELDVLFASQNPFDHVPPVLGRCASLRVFGMKSCKIERVEEGALPPNVEWLILTDNRIERLPEQLGDLSRLRKVSLAGNRLRDVPDMSRCTQIEFLRIAANELSALPDFVSELPQLAWFGDNGNPYSVPREPAVEMIERDDLVLGKTLNESPSSMVYATEHDGQLSVYKEYKGGVVSDGYAEDDLRMALLAPQSQYVVNARVGVQRGTKLLGVLMDRLEDRFVPLGLPPTLDSCTRDVYPEGFRLSKKIARRVLECVQEAVETLHQNNITHGDIYAHNILYDPNTGDAVLTDFGAATCVDALELWRIRSDEKALAILQAEVLNFS